MRLEQPPGGTKGKGAIRLGTKARPAADCNGAVIDDGDSVVPDQDWNSGLAVAAEATPLVAALELGGGGIVGCDRLALEKTGPAIDAKYLVQWLHTSRMGYSCP